MTTHLNRSGSASPGLRTVVAGAAVLLLVGACSNGDDEPANEQVEEESPDVTSTTTQPASSEESALAIVEDIVVEANALVDDLLQNPEVVDEQENDQIERLRELHTEDSPTPDGVIAQLHDLADNAQRERPAASGVFSDFGIYRVTAVDDDTIRFSTCSTEDSETVDADGNVVDQRAQVTQGVGEARRVDGVWQVYGINPDDDRTLPIEPGSANPGFCDQLFAESEEP